jgi:hypothetical protein
MLRVDAAGALALVRLEGLDGQAELLAQRGGYEGARGMGKPLGLFHHLGQRRPILPFEQTNNQLGLAALTRPSRILRLRGLFGFRRAFGGGGLLPLSLRGRALGSQYDALGLFVRLRLRGCRFGIRGLAQIGYSSRSE